MLWVYLALGIYFAKELRDWLWWHNWEGDEDEPNPAPVLSRTWRAWQWLSDGLFSWVWANVWWPLRQLCDRFRSPGAPPSEPVDQDGWTPIDWLVINAWGVWDPVWRERCKDVYDVQVRRNWEECLARDGAEMAREGDSNGGRREMSTATTKND